MDIIWSFLFYAIFCVLFFSLSLYISIPAMLKIIPSSVNYGVFRNYGYFRSPRLDKPAEAWKLEKVENIFIKLDGKQRLGLWLMSPLYQPCQQEIKRIVLYCHGNGSHRARKYRLEMYRFLRENGFHVVTFDYRGFADSKGKASERNAVDDIITVYSWMLSHDMITDDSQVLLLGHSLGSSLATQALCKMQARQDLPRLPDGLILQAPFDKLGDVAKSYPLARSLSSWYPGNLFANLLTQAFQKVQLNLNTVNVLPLVKCPVLIFHAEDDTNVNISLGQSLFASACDAIDSRCSNLKYIKFVSFKRTHGIGHNFIYKYSGLQAILDDFCKTLENPFPVQEKIAIQL